MLEAVERRFRAVAPKADFCSLRVVCEREEQVSVRQGVLEPVGAGEDLGGMVTVLDEGGLGYAATSDLSQEGLARAVREAHAWARKTAGHTVADYARVPRPQQGGEWRSPVEEPWESMALPTKIDLLRQLNEQLKSDARIVDWEAGLRHVSVESTMFSVDGPTTVQRFSFLIPSMSATANHGAHTEQRTFGRMAQAHQGGLEHLRRTGFLEAAPRISRQALELLQAPDCPSGKLDLLLAPDQMILQIHESIGHPLELDRILGDERNYAGTSFVTLDMFGTFQYGSKLLNVTFDPTIPHQLASYAFDDDGTPARREYVIKDGVLVRPLGGATSQARAGIEGVANARACSWNRPPIDRMANLNVEPGDSTLEQMIAAVEDGVYMESNCSWSIDDSRNKFQFGCEYARLIKGGKLGAVVKKPNYRGVSRDFWRSLKMVGDRSTFQVLGTPNCGKGEPNQLVRVGHASPACLFAQVDVFGPVKDGEE